MPNERLEYLRRKALSLPSCPGVYIMKNKSGSVIYVGKSKALKNRVTQYFKAGGHDSIKTDRMVSNVYDFEYIVCDSEIEALALENNKIKQYTPRYNIKLKDDKNYPYIKVTVNAEYPRILMSRTRKEDGARYFGPYSGTAPVYSIIKTLEKDFGIPSCRHEFPRDIGKVRPCIYSQMKRCCAPCTGLVSTEAYREIVDGALAVLKGDSTALKKDLEQKMQKAAQELAFEAAAKYRDRIQALERLYEKQKVVASPGVHHDVIAYYSDEISTAVSVFYVRDGIIADRENYNFLDDKLFVSENISSFIVQLYEKRGYAPREIFVYPEISEDDAISVSEYLSRMMNGRVTVKTPKKGVNRAFCSMVFENAKESARQYQRAGEDTNQMLVRLASMLKLEVVPERIEAYDISNYGDEHITAGMIVSVSGKYKKSDYKVFKIRTTDGQNDYGAMTEAVRRRIENAQQGEESFLPLPDLILLDGGKGHVSCIKELLAQMGADIPVFGMVKDEYHKTRSLCDAENEISISKDKELFLFIYKLQEEVHRFTVSRMSRAKRKTLKTSSLTKIKGVGEAKAKKLLAAFDSLEEIQSADADTLCAKARIDRGTAENIRAYFQHEKTDKSNKI